MAEAQKQDAGGRCAADGDQFGSLLQKEFKPKTDGARAEVESAVRTLAEQALRETTVVSDDVIGTIKAIIAEIDKQAHRPDQRDPAQRALPAGGERVARPAAISSTTPKRTRC